MVFILVVIFEPTLGVETCTEGAKQCHLNAQCVDYSTGFCCKCLDNYYGNGRSCLEKGECLCHKLMSGQLQQQWPQLSGEG